jgi:hypothetical protein
MADLLRERIPDLVANTPVVPPCSFHIVSRP